MNVNEFYEMTPRQFYNKTKGYTEQRNEDVQQAWEIMRFSTTALLNIHLKKTDKIDPQKLVKFPWDKQQKQRSMSLQEFEAIIANG